VCVRVCVCAQTGMRAVSYRVREFRPVPMSTERVRVGLSVVRLRANSVELSAALFTDDVRRPTITPLAHSFVRSSFS
jgi:hypothetical protein